MFEITSKQGKARTGLLIIGNKRIETPFFMPVCTKATAKQITIKELSEIKAKAIISNSMLLYLQPGVDVIKKAGGLHKFMNYDGVIFTDSGGFQMLNKSLYIKTTSQGILFRNPFNGEKITITPEIAMQYQIDLGSDVAMMLDHLPPHTTTHKDTIESLKINHEYAERAKRYHDKQKTKQLLFGIAQGCIYADLRKKSAEFIKKLDFDGIALGGLCIGETKQKMYECIKHTMPILPENKPKYLMGVGTPEDLLKCVSEGIDIFDSRYPTMTGRNGTAYTTNGQIDLRKKKYKEDFTPINKNCDCTTCKNHTKAYIHHLVRMGEVNAGKYTSIHNVRFLLKLMEDIRQSIKKGKFEKFKKEFLKEFLVRRCCASL